MTNGLMPQRTCYAAKCDCMVPHHLLMCRRHWSMVPTNLASQIIRQYHNRHLGGFPTKEYIELCQQARAVVKAKEEHGRTA